VYDGLGSLPAQSLAHARAVGEVALDELRALDDRAAVTFVKIVEDDDLVAVFNNSSVTTLPM
jgi:transcriptional regulator NrdR family protein